MPATPPPNTVSIWTQGRFEAFVLPGGTLEVHITTDRVQRRGQGSTLAEATADALRDAG